MQMWVEKLKITINHSSKGCTWNITVKVAASVPAV